MEKPIKRSPHLIPISREHHHALLLCWKIEMGLKKGIEPARIKTYADWFYTQHLLPHFAMEEEHLFPILGHENERVRQALEEHQQLRRFFAEGLHTADALRELGDTLEKHIRFEERVLFNEIQTAATTEQLEHLSGVLKEDTFVENTQDIFWEWQ